MDELNFLQPQTLAEAKSLIRKESQWKLLAGGTDLVLNIRKSYETNNSIVSLGKILELKTIKESEGKVIIGAMVTFNDLIESKVIKNNYNSLLRSSLTMGSPQIRNVATIGGNIVNAGSAADAIPCIISLEGVLVIESLEKTRCISCEDYFKRYHEEKVKPNEILTKIILSKKKCDSGYYKLSKRNSLAIARLSAALTIRVEEDKIKSLNICLGAVGKYPFRAKELEEQGLNKQVNWLYSEEASKLLSDAVEKSIGGRKTMPFKREAIKGVFKEALNIALDKQDSLGNGGDLS
ncbi:MAG: FAD binding domain-containing protein [Clostridium sp.]|uniref:FAD binding domain-containing protein n=1 Tax=Clostridium sp. TaxID=1506 RepID=UPI0030579197